MKLDIEVSPPAADDSDFQLAIASFADLHYPDLQTCKLHLPTS